MTERSDGGEVASRSREVEPDSATRPLLEEEHAGPHLVQFYEHEDFLTDRVAKFLAEGLQQGDVVTVIATGSHGRAYRHRLESRGIDVARACADGQLTFLDADETLATFMRSGEPDARLFEAEVGGLIERQSRNAGSKKLRAYGEMVDVLWKQGQKTAALRLEELWNALQARHSFSLLCAYAMASFYKQPGDLQRVCATHTHVMLDDHHVATDDTEPPPTPLPPRYARRLAKEIAQREEVELALRESLRELRAKEDALRLSEEQLRDFVENATLGLHRVASDGTILWANRAELQMLGYDESEYVGRRIDEFHADQSTIDHIMSRLSCGEELHNYEARLRAKDGTFKYVLISSNVYRQDGKFIHTRCFTRDITERRTAQEALRRSEQQLQLVTDALPALVSYVDADQRYRFASGAYERWFGRPSADFLGKSLEEVLGPSAYAAIRPHVERALAGERVSYEAELSYPDGNSRFVEATYVPQAAEEGQPSGFVALVNDITARKAFERFRLASAARTEKLLKITAAIADAISADQVFEALVDRVSEVVEATSAGLWLVGDDGNTARLVRALGYADTTRDRLAVLSLETSPAMPVLDSIRRGEAIWIPSQGELLERYPHLGALVTPERSYRVCCLPLMARGKILGALGLTIETSHELLEEERDFLQLTARYASQALERLRLFEAERRSRAEADNAAARLGVLSRASRVFAETDLDLASRLSGIVPELGAALASCTGISLLGPDGLLHTAAAYHPLPEAQELLQTLRKTAPLRPGEGVTGAVIASGKSVLIPSVSTEEMTKRAAPPYHEFLKRYPVYAMMCAPLRARGEIIGTVMATRANPGETYTPDDLQLFEQLAERAANAIENSQLYEETRAARTRAEQLYRFAQAVVVADQVDTVFDAALGAIEAALGAKRAAILTMDSAFVMRFSAWRNLSEGYRVAVEGHSPWPPHSTAPEPVLVADAQRDPTMAGYAHLFRSEGIGALAFVPLVSRGRLLGKFMVYYEEPHRFAPFEVETALSIANHLASVIARFSAVSALEDTIRGNELFAGVLAHDLRNPLGAITTAAQLLLMRHEGSGPAADGETKPLSRILSSGQRMTRMIDQLLDFTRARTGGGIELNLRDGDLGTLCRDVLGEFEVAHPEWKMHCEIIGDVSGSWDADRLLQVISNLLANAGQHGHLDAGIHVKLDGGHPDFVRIEVHNDGSVPESILPHLFDPFRTTRHGRGKSEGLGLGLFIVREIVRAHGGTVEISSSEASGTTFLIQLPRSGALRPGRTETRTSGN
jgi:PAS domain S-box-containing protein